MYIDFFKDMAQDFARLDRHLNSFHTSGCYSLPPER